MTSSSKVQCSTELKHVILQDFPNQLYYVPSTRYSIDCNNHSNSNKDQRFIVVETAVDVSSMHEIIPKDNKLLSHPYLWIDTVSSYLHVTHVTYP